MIPPTLTIKSTDLRLYSDASDIGFGATYQNKWIQGAWDEQHLAQSMDYRELYAILAATYTWGAHWEGQRIVFITDNKPITQVWDKTTSPSISLMSLIRPLYQFAALNGFSISFKHIFGKINIAADALSRFQMEEFFSAMPEADKLPTEVPRSIASIQVPLPSKTSNNKPHPSSKTR